MPAIAVEVAEERRQSEQPQTVAGAVAHVSVRWSIGSWVAARSGVPPALAMLLAAATMSWNLLGSPRFNADEGRTVADAYGWAHGPNDAALLAYGHLPGVPLIIAGWSRVIAWASGAVAGLQHLTSIQQRRLILVVLAALQASLLYLVIRRLTSSPQPG